MTRSTFILFWFGFMTLPLSASETGPVPAAQAQAPSTQTSSADQVEVGQTADVPPVEPPRQEGASNAALPSASLPVDDVADAIGDPVQGDTVKETEPPLADPAPLLDNGEQDEIRYQQALNAMQAGDYAVAFCLWKPLAEGGHAKAQFSLGWMYHNGYGLSINNRKALDWWEKAADRGIANAAFALGLLFSNGDQDIRKDIPRASHYFQQAALLEHDDARSMLAHLFEEYPQEMQALSKDWTERQWGLVGRVLSIRVERANMRSGPGLENPVLKVLAQGMRVAERVRKPRWVEVSIPGDSLRGWIYASLLEEVSQAGDTLGPSTPRVEPDAPRAGAVNPPP